MSSYTSRINAINRVLNRGGRIQRNFSKLQFKPLTDNMRKRLEMQRALLVKAQGRVVHLNSDIVTTSSGKKELRNVEPINNPNRVNGKRLTTSRKSFRPARTRQKV